MFTTTGTYFETMQMFKEEGREEDALRVKIICDVAEEFAPEYDEEKVMAAVSAGIFV